MEVPLTRARTSDLLFHHSAPKSSVDRVAFNKTGKGTNKDVRTLTRQSNNKHVHMLGLVEYISNYPIIQSRNRS